MITFFASLAGFLSSAIPELFKLLHDRSDKKHEIMLLSMQIEVQKAALDGRLQEIGVRADSAETAALYRTWYSGVKWVDALNGTVRPLITYAFFFLYAGVKYVQYQVIGDNAPLFMYMDALWNVEDQAIFAGIISFYFGQRAMGKRRG
jgi:hypothetical protein